MSFLDFLCHPAGHGVAAAPDVLQKCDVTEGQWGIASVGEIRKAIQEDLEQGEHLKQQRGNPPGETARSPQDSSTGQNVMLFWALCHTHATFITITK